jgi:hypothetical protein
MRLGSLAHCAVLEPDELHNRYAIAPDRRSNAGKALAADMAARGLEAVTEPEMALAPIWPMRSKGTHMLAPC